MNELNYGIGYTEKPILLTESELLEEYKSCLEE